MLRLGLKLRDKLLAFAAVLVLVPGLLIGLIAERTGRDSLERMIGGQLAREAAHTADRVNALFRVERDSLYSFARQEVMREVRVGDIDKRISQALATLRNGKALRLDYVVLDQAGQAVAASNPAHLGGPPGWALAARQAQGSPLPYAAEEGVVLVTRVADPDTSGTSLGYLFALLDWRFLDRLAVEAARDLQKRGIAGDVMIARSDGVAIGAANETDSANREGRAVVVAGARREADYVVESRLRQIIGRVRLADDLPPWSVLVLEPMEHAYAPVVQLRNRIAVTTVLALVSALTLAAFAAPRVTRPLTKLTQAIRALSRGDPAILRVPVESHDEVGTLAASFNHMSSELDRVQRNLVEAEKFAFVGELAGGVAHEVRTSLGVLRSSAQILARSMPPGAEGDAPELAQMIRDEADRLAGVVDDLLTLDRPRPLQLTRVCVSGVLWRAADFVESQAEAKGVTIRREGLEQEAAVLCDEEMIYQVAVNLIVNAVQALATGGVVELEILEPRDGLAGFAVRDDGAGVPEALRERIFQPFVTARDGGVGLGLTFVKRVVYEHQGHIALEPGIGSGACFRVELPVVEAAA